MVLLALVAGGCAGRHHHHHCRASHDDVPAAFFKSSILVPGRDLVTADPLWRLMFGGEARDDGTDGSPFHVVRTPEKLLPQRVALGACTAPPPELPLKILKPKKGGATPGFIGEDAGGRKFLVKLDHPDYPELGSTAEVVGSRLLWALGYHVPPVYLVQISGTGDPRFDGQRATATLFIEDARGHFHFDWFRDRREVRGLRLACAWLNDTDRVGPNTLVTVTDDVVQYYLIDFNSCLGSWQGRPKEVWRGWRHQGHVGWWLAGVVTLGLVHPEPDPTQPIVSAAIGRFTADGFDARRWRPQWHNGAFKRMTAKDARWLTAQLARLDRPQIEAAVAAAELSDPRDAAYLVQTLLRRRDIILQTFGDGTDAPPTR
ncbi:MAG: hypothetical protein PVJ57_10460 [Phycisphaerae bacterium]